MIQPDFFLAIGSVAGLLASIMFYCTSGQQRLLTRSLSGSAGVGGGIGLTLCMAGCFSHIMSLTTALFVTVVLLMLWLCLLPVSIALVKPRGTQR
ncbi:MAG: hypothetical protein ABF876_10735 [Acetobacter aceti]|uniref:Uncharacterized protein n=1 Tax=Acetobacter aceti TaxID=435 RepID=A0A1U9KJG5_ACEAC|nr:hypothetical protein [Acetobacter aceti]AQS85869.1 hypothetical protein A0U92_15085 [Acetobacter aceti]